MIYGNAIGGTAPIKTLTIVDENNNEYVGVVTGSEVIFDATPADVKINKTFVSNEGILVGKNTITYRTTTGYKLIQSGEAFTIPLADYNQYDYTKFQAIIVPYNTNFSNSVAAEKIVLNDCIYAVGSTDKIADVVKNDDTKSIDFNIINDSNKNYMVYYFTYHEEE